MRPFSVALVHYPILARDGSIVTTSITNLDIHDIARSSFTYGADAYYLVHPIEAQRELALRVVEHWTNGSGALRIPDRKPPMQSVRVVHSIEQVREEFSRQVGGEVEIWVTSAQWMSDALSHGDAADLLRQEGPPVVLVLGTGWGLAREVTDAAERRLAPIVSPRPDGYNHLSVRAAAAILLDRLVGGTH